jgi:hypothetical protein
MKDDVNYFKQELSSDEKVLQSAFKIEGLYKKHRVKLFVVVGALFLFWIGTTIQTSLHESRLFDANEALLTLQSDSSNQEARAILKEKNPALYELYAYKEAINAQDSQSLDALTTSQNSIIADMSRYQKGILEAQPTDSILYKDMALFTQAYLALEQKDTKEAQRQLQEIDERSSLSMLSNLLQHATLKVQ